MINFFGVIFLTLLISLPILLIDIYFGSNYLVDFLKSQALQIMGTLLGLNIATASFLVGHLTNIEINLKKTYFNNSKREIKHNLYFMIIIFIIQVALLTAIPTLSENSPEWVGTVRIALIYFGLAIFLLSIYALCEMTRAIFLIDKIIKKEN